jgi:hypothetical protein
MQYTAAPKSLKRKYNKMNGSVKTQKENPSLPFPLMGDSQTKPITANHAAVT